MNVQRQALITGIVINLRAHAEIECPSGRYYILRPDTLIRNTIGFSFVANRLGLVGSPGVLCVCMFVLAITLIAFSHMLQHKHQSITRRAQAV